MSKSTNENRNWVRKKPILYSSAKSLHKTYFSIIGPFHVLPDFIIIGAMKSGTTSLYYDLCEHPCIVPAAYDEIGFFDSNFELGINWYKSLFPNIFQKYLVKRSQKYFITGEDTPFYFWKSQTAKRISHILPHVKLIAILRNPVDRAFSNYNDTVRYDAETLSFEDAIKDEIKKIESITTTDQDFVDLVGHRTNIVKGLYAKQLKIWLSLFPREQIIILSSEDLISEPQEVLGKAFEFLDLPPYSIKDFQKRKVAKNPPMKPETRRYLVEYYKPHNEQFYKLSQVNFGWDR